MSATIERGTVKLCSLRRPEHADAAVSAGADLVGLIFAPARRQVTIAEAARIVARLRDVDTTTAVRVVGVFVDADVATINRTIDAVGLDLVQLHGSEPPEAIGGIDRPAIKALRPELGTTGEELRRIASRYFAVDRPVEAILLEGHSRLAAGGTGVGVDWRLAESLAREFPVILAGGLRPDSVGEAIDAVKPIGVDVSGGVERDGEKDPAMMRDFVAAARLAFRSESDLSRQQGSAAGSREASGARRR